MGTVTRPIYETTADLDEEQRIAEVICKVWKCEVRKLPREYRLDYAAVKNGEVVAWIEVKRRHYDREHFETIFLSMHKVMTAHSLAAASGMRCFFVVKFNDCLAYADIVDSALGRSIQFGGRVDRADWQDVEPCLMIPSRDFKVIKVPDEPA